MTSSRQRPPKFAAISGPSAPPCPGSTCVSSCPGRRKSRNTAASPDHVYDEVFTAFPRGTPRPAFGSLVSRFSPAPACGLPAYVGLSRTLSVERPLYAGAAHAPFRPREEAVADLGRNVSLARLQDRKALL